MNNAPTVKEIQLDLLQNFIQICKDNDLRYFLLGGSCLGAVRHKGYIPWDDDIDVGMPRSDYEKFLMIAQQKLPDYVFVQTHDTDINYPHGFAKLRNSNTTFIESSVKNLNVNHGIYIDIFPLDGTYANKFRYKMQLLKIQLLSKSISRVFSLHKGRSLRESVLRTISFIYAPSVNYAINKREKLMKKVNFDDATIVANWCGAWAEKEIMPKSYFADGTTASFDGIEVVIPKEYDQYLTRMYGDYMELPPEEKRVSHHYNEVIDTTKSYKEYIK